SIDKIRLIFTYSGDPPFLDGPTPGPLRTTLSRRSWSYQAISSVPPFGMMVVEVETRTVKITQKRGAPAGSSGPTAAVRSWSAMANGLRLQLEHGNEGRSVKMAEK